jgi:hypothetical protein
MDDVIQMAVIVERLDDIMLDEFNVIKIGNFCAFLTGSDEIIKHDKFHWFFQDVSVKPVEDFHKIAPEKAPPPREQNYFAGKILRRLADALDDFIDIGFEGKFLHVSKSLLLAAAQ